MNNEFQIFNNINLEIGKEIIKIRKGVFNFFNIDIQKNDNFTNEEFEFLIQVFDNLKKGKTVSFDFDSNAVNELKDILLNYRIIHNKVKKFNIDFLLTDFSDFSIFKNYEYFKNAKVIKISNFTENMVKELNIKNIAVIFNVFNESLIKNINKILFKYNIKSYFIFNDGDYIHALFVDNDYSGCFECFIHRLYSRIRNEIFSDFKNDDFKNTDIEKNKNNLQFMLSLVNLIIENSQRYESILLNSKIFSLYLPAFEIHYDRLLKISYCSTCGYNSRLQSQELNINTKQAVKELLNNE